MQSAKNTSVNKIGLFKIMIVELNYLCFYNLFTAKGFLQK
ncbi:hypothetical protein GYO_2149 [Bacillus spizizenii TU-B-10]|uniref:Uncharacterized protein n=1 Tax=Bacillus spizizenii (strain DSM 15029 / JCM 12233 / NBRC 101239 / NRRL B-23049 / TU-B-10) TaxID=1052585 RepID=G4NVV0_BACS4|nr:hypothetical protein GYO_2149 [Bacillus spizizenii TU-B-10]SCV41380.1 hypothetical protein BQ1740_2459 [Bacillus subtilis]